MHRFYVSNLSQMILKFNNLMKHNPNLANLMDSVTIKIIITKYVLPTVLIKANKINQNNILKITKRTTHNMTMLQIRFLKGKDRYPIIDWATFHS